jgi:ribosomal-protein-alanine N-acetyltransferase
VSAHRLETKRVVLLPWDSEDWLAFKPIATDPQVMRYVSEGGQPWTDAQIAEFVERQRNHYRERGFCLWKMVSRDSEGMVGFCGLQPLTGTSEIEIGWWLSPGLWGQGIATEAAAAALADAFGRSGLDRWSRSRKRRTAPRLALWRRSECGMNAKPRIEVPRCPVFG